MGISRHESIQSGFSTSAYKMKDLYLSKKKFIELYCQADVKIVVIKFSELINSKMIYSISTEGRLLMNEMLMLHQILDLFCQLGFPLVRSTWSCHFALLSFRRLCQELQFAKRVWLRKNQQVRHHLKVRKILLDTINLISLTWYSLSTAENNSWAIKFTSRIIKFILF